jgi:hypothetical protein
MPDALLAQRQMENLGRGVVALHSATSQAYVSWRLLVTDPTLKRSHAGACGNAVKGLQAMLAHLGHIEASLGPLMHTAGDAQLMGEQILECVP